MTEIAAMLGRDNPARVRFVGPETADLFTMEVRESMNGVLSKNYHSDPEDENVGFVSASVDGRFWTGTMWTRDAGVFIREMTHWGYIEHACLTVDCLIRMVLKNEAGFFTFPERFDLGEPASGHELDGTAAIIIGMVLLWQRLPKDHVARERIFDFLHAPTSPLRYIENVLRTNPLIPGSGEFGGGCGIGGLFMNVVQNNMVRLALIIAAQMELEVGDTDTAQRYQSNAELLDKNIHEFLLGEDGAWIWCIDPVTHKPNPEIIDHVINKGFGGINGVACMLSDVLGMEPLESGWSGIEPCLKTFDKLYAFPKRKEQFEKYGIWTQFDEFLGGYMTGPSYGHGYALQTMLLFDKMDMAERALNYLAETTYYQPKEYPLTRECPYWFFERYQSVDAIGIVEWDECCGALNLVCVAEPLKIARLMVGVDDTSSDHVTIIPRIPASWTGFEVENLPIRTPNGLVRADISYLGGLLKIDVKDGLVPNLILKTGTAGQRKTQQFTDVRSLKV